MPRPARLIGINHVALEVGDVEEALEFYGRLFEFELRGPRAGHGRSSTWATSSSRWPRGASSRATTAATSAWSWTTCRRSGTGSAQEGIEAIETGGGSGFDFYDPWGNRIEVVEYGEIQFERTPGVKRKLGIEALDKSEAARREIDERGLA